MIQVTRQPGFNLLHQARGVRRMVLVLPFLATIILAGHRSSLDAQRAVGDVDQSFEQLFVSGLRQRRLFELAEAHCNEQLQRSDLDPTRRTNLILELLKTQVAVATQSSATQQEAQWNRVDQTASHFVEQEKSQPRAILIVVQQALIPLARATLIRREMEFRGSDNPQATQRALSLLRQSIDRLRKSLAAVQQLKSARIREKPREEHPLNLEQLMALEKNIQFETATCDLNRARLYPENDRINRLDTLTQVLKQLDLVSRQLPESNDLWFDVRIRQIQANRLLKKRDVADQMLKKLAQLDWDEVQRQRLRNEQIQLALSSGELALVAKSILQSDPQCHPFQPLDITTVRLALELAIKDSDEDSKRRWQNFAVALSEKIKSNHGAYWGRMADLLMVDVAKSKSLPSNVQILVRLGEQHLRKQKYKEAIEVFDSAFEIAAEQDDDQAAFSIGYRVAMIVQQQKQNDLAADRLRLLANRFEDHQAAATTHLMACWNKAQATRDDVEKQIEYEQMLKENINTWPNSKNVDRAKTWLGKLYEHQRQFRAAFEVYANIKTDSDYFSGNAESLCNSALNSLAVNSTVKREDLVSIKKSMDQLVADATQTDQNRDALRQLRLTRAQLELLYDGDAAKAEQWLQTLLKEDELSPAIQMNASLWLVVALSQQPNREQETSKLLESLSIRANNSADWLRGLATIDPEYRSPEIARIKLQVANAILADGPAETEIAAWELVSAKALVATGKTTAAIKKFESLVKDHPRSFQFKLEFARALTTSNQETVLENGLKQWRIIARQVKPESEIWYEAKYQVAATQHKLGQSNEAGKLIRYIKATTTNWEQNAWRLRFEQLMKQISKGD